MSDDNDIRKTSVSSAPAKKSVSVTFNSSVLAKVLVVVLIALGAFWLGTIYGHHEHSSTASSNVLSSSGRYGGFHGGGFGTVSAISASSISVVSSRTGTTTTYSITSSTKITDAGQSVNASSIDDGDRVVVIPSSSSSTTASEILVNPNFGGFNGGGGSGSSTGGSNVSGSGTTE